MSRHISKRVSYECGWCKKQFTLNKQSVDDSEKSGEVFCSKRCSEQFYLSDKMIPQIKCPICGNTEVYRISRLVIPEPEGRETVYVDYSLARSEEPGNYECVDGHQFKIEAEFVDKYYL